jgi:hypothetical protein
MAHMHTLGIRVALDYDNREEFAVYTNYADSARRLASILMAPKNQGLTGYPMVVGVEIINKRDQSTKAMGEALIW